ncbi:class I SAM-dependent methyltransferase [Pseudomonas entomophila]|uniref:class I SAM-dependent methyltransferase n=1 Tax=Pseudomonas entomophila TaxID=312306 RepID=UPI0023D80C2C|nr:class I SAM-dependent methyltransferase [Pseudomonas entomophila]MDF0729307.1 class I SAM-dependent methyltransferase [Pseudomonas entomophila]
MKIVDSSVLKHWYEREYSACANGVLFGELRPEFRQFLATLGNGPGQALELGCGDGRNLLALADKGFAVTGVDMIDSRVVAGRFDFQQADILNYTPATGAYDVVVCSEVLHFFPPAELEQVMPKLLQALTPGGHLFVDLLADLSRHFQASGEPFVWDKEAGLGIQQAEAFFDRWLSGFEIIQVRHLFDRQHWPLSDAEQLPIAPYTWQGTYVSVCARKRHA